VAQPGSWRDAGNGWVRLAHLLQVVALHHRPEGTCKRRRTKAEGYRSERLARERQDPPGAGAGWKAAWVVTFAQLFVHLICSRQSRQAALEAQTRGAGVQREKKAALRAQRAPDTAIYDAQRSSSRSFLTHRSWPSSSQYLLPSLLAAAAADPLPPLTFCAAHHTQYTRARVSEGTTADPRGRAARNIAGVAAHRPLRRVATAAPIGMLPLVTRRRGERRGCPGIGPPPLRPVHPLQQYLPAQ
jgi:hypothetical protein